MLDEGRLHGMQLTILGEPLDGDNFSAFMLHSQGQAGIDTLSIHQDSASTAGSLVTAFFRTRQIQVVAKSVQQRDSGFNGERSLLAVDVKRKVLKLVWRFHCAPFFS